MLVKEIILIRNRRGEQRRGAYPKVYPLGNPLGRSPLLRSIFNRDPTIFLLLQLLAQLDNQEPEQYKESQHQPNLA
jgi:hypothetical protein